MNSACIVHRKLSRNLLNRVQLIATISTTDTAIKIPKRIKRGPTDILKALEKTIKKDPSAAHYKYHDDPYLMPQSKVHQRTFALARESGRKTAKWVRAQHYDLFQHKVAEPMIPGFVPDPPIDDETLITEDILMSTILRGDTENALEAYNKLDKDVSIPTKQALLELLCIFNQPTHLIDDLPENNWFMSLPEKRIWEDKQEIYDLFEFLKKQDKDVAAAAYSAMICGTAKHFNVAKAWNYYNVCKEKSIPLNVNVYNLLISRVPLLKQSDTNCRNMILELLNAMISQKVHPNIGTLNACLIAVANMQSAKVSANLTQQLFKEFKKFKINPSLASYAVALGVFKRTGYAYDTFFTEILNTLQQKMPPIQDMRDIYFFKIAMESALHDLCSREIADKIHELFQTGDNYKLIGGQFKEIVYYRSYMLIVLATETLQEFQKFYENIVPHVYIPEPSLMRSILKALEPCTNQDIIKEFLPKLWSDITQFSQTDAVGNLALQLMCTHVKFVPESPLNEVFCNAAWTYWSNYVKLQNDQKDPTWSSGSLGNILTLFARGRNFYRMSSILEKALNHKIPISDRPTTEEFEEVLDALILYGHNRTAFLLLDYALYNSESNAAMIADKMQKQMKLSEHERANLMKIIQENGLDVKLETEE